ncbi:aminoglycoside phosphotransferase family protein, partial [Streptomyces atratus]|uniref:aminoglycoside phosphotransferase family protein n=1 Tax=Streptomyces atratus TaxID=1893 RepID=UPI00378F76CF
RIFLPDPTRRQPPVRRLPRTRPVAIDHLLPITFQTSPSTPPSTHASPVTCEIRMEIDHWDLHYDNILAADREPWLAIDPKPLAGDPGFDLMPALSNDFDLSEVLYRFDLMTEVLGLDRQRAAAWTLGRALQNLLWNLEDEDDGLNQEQLAIAQLLLER